MKIKNITLNNFRPFFGETSLDIQDTAERIVFLGANDSGKTEILNSIYWCIWGEMLSKLISPRNWTQAWQSGKKEPGLFNNKAFWELENDEIQQVMVSVEFSLEKDETQNVDSVSNPTLELTRSLYFGKNMGKPVLYEYNDDVFSDTEWYENPDKLTQLRTASWTGQLSLRHPTSNGNQSISQDSLVERDYYFPNKDVTRFTLLDSVILNKYLTEGQDENEKNINSVSNVNNIVKISRQVKDIESEYQTKKDNLERQSVGSNIALSNMIEERDKIQRDLNTLTEDKSEEKDEIFRQWDKEFKEDIKNGNDINLKRFQPHKYSNINVIQFRIQFLTKIEQTLTDIAGDTETGSDLVQKWNDQKKLKRDTEKKLLDKQQDASNNYVDLSIRTESIKVLREFDKNINVTKYTPPPLTKEYLEHLLNEDKTCCCGVPLNDKDTPELVRAIKELIKITVDKSTSSQLANIHSRSSKDFINNEYLALHFKALEEDINDIKKLDGEIEGYDGEINKLIESINRLGGVDKINQTAAEIKKQKKTVELRQKYLNSRQAVVAYKTTLDAHKTTLSTKLSDIEKLIKGHNLTIDGLDEAKTRLDFCIRVGSKLNELKDDFQKDIKDKIKDGFKKEFEKMHWRGDYQVNISDDFKISLEDRKGMNLTSITSQGGSQMACIAFMRTLSRFSSLNMPLVADTPFGNLQNKVRTNVADLLLSDDISPQLFLLCSDSELSSPPKLSKIIFDSIKDNKICCYEIERIPDKDAGDYSKPKKVTIKKMKELLKSSIL